MIVGLNHQIPTTNVEVQALRPVGSIIKLYVNTNPAALLGFGVWSRISQGRVSISINEVDPDISIVTGTGGAKTHSLVSEENGRHNHTGTGGSASHNHEESLILTTNTTVYHTHTASNRGLGEEVWVRSGSTSTQLFTTIQGSVVEGGEHTHKITGETDNNTASGSGTTSSAGSGQAHNNLPPFFSVYIWKRTA